MAEGPVCFPVVWQDQEFADNLDATLRKRVEVMAGRALHQLTAYQVGGCAITIRPCLPRCAPGTWMTAPVSGALPWAPYLSNGSWFNACGCHNQSCSCSVVHELALPGPVSEILSVVDGGVILPESAYRLDNESLLVRTDGKAWPTCQNIAAANDAKDAFSITYVRGVDPGKDGAYVAGFLAKEFALAIEDDGNCRLPPSVTSVVRQGVSMDFAQGQFPGGVTGVPEVDAWVQFWNPYKVVAPAAVYSPDAREPRRTTWAGSSAS